MRMSSKSRGELHLQVAARNLLERTDALLRGMPELQALSHQGSHSAAFTSLDAYAEARYCCVHQPRKGLSMN